MDGGETPQNEKNERKISEKVLQIEGECVIIWNVDRKESGENDRSYLLDFENCAFVGKIPAAQAETE